MKKSVSCVGLVMVVLVSALSPACKKPAGPAGHSDHAAPAAGAPTPAPAAHAAHLPPGYAAVEVDQARQQLLGMKTLVVRRQPFERLIRTVGIVQTDETRTAHVHVKFDGFIEKIYVNFTGKQVKKGQPLLRIFSRDLLAAEQEYLASRAALGRTQGASAEAGRSAAQQLVGASRERLRLFDIPESVLQKIERTGVAERAITLLSPLTGTVIEKQAIEGLAVTPMAHLYIIADLSRVWVAADVYERDLAQVAVGQPAELQLEALPERSFKGNVTFVSPVLGESSRTAKVRFEFPNADGRLRPGMYATVQMKAGQGEGLALPSDSVIDTGERKIVFVATGPGRFEPRAIVTGAAFAGQYEVREGLAEGDVIAANGQFLLDSESRIRGAQTGGAQPAHRGH